MPLLQKLADCMGLLARAPMTSPPLVNTLQPVADADISFGWQGYLFSSDLKTGILALGTVGASVTITEDCFYILDATGLGIDAAASGTKRVALEILDTAGNICWQLSFAWNVTQITAVGVPVVGNAGEYSLRLHLTAGMIVRWRLLDATTTATGSLATSLALRKLYQDTH